MITGESRLPSTPTPEGRLARIPGLLMLIVTRIKFFR